MASKEISDARKKRTKSFALDDNLIDKLEKLSSEGYFGSQSNIVSIALNDFFTKHAELLQKDMDMDRLLREYLNSPEGEAVVKEAIRRMFLGVGDEKKIDVVYESYNSNSLK